MRKKLLFLFGSLFLLTGCATSMVANLTTHKGHYVPSGDSNMGLIYFYRESSLFGTVRCMYIDLDSKRVGALNSGTYFVYEAPAGEIVVSAENWIKKDQVLTIKIEAGESYYIKGWLEFGVIDTVPSISLVTNEKGSKAVSKLIYATMKEKDL